MKKFWVLFCLLFLLTACNSDSEGTPTEGEAAEIENEESTDAEQEGETTDEALQLSEIEYYLDNMVIGTNSVKIISDIYEKFENEDEIDSEYHEEIHYVNDKQQVYRSLHAISFSNLFIEIYANEQEGYRSDNSGEWEQFTDTEMELINPFDRRVSLLNELITSPTNVQSTNSEVAFDITNDYMGNVINGIFQTYYGYPYEEESLEVESISAVIYAAELEIQGYKIVVNLKDTESNSNVEFIFEDKIFDVNAFTEIEFPAEVYGG